MERRNKVITITVPLIIILAAAVVYQYGSARIRAENEAVEEIQQVKLKTLEKYVSLISQQPQIERRMAALKEMRKAQDAKIIEGQTVPLASANLQGNVRTLITGRGGSIFSERVEKPEDLGRMKVISISVDAAIPDTKVLGDILYAIETQAPYLVIKELDSRIANNTKPKDLIVKFKIAAMTAGR